MIEIEGSQPTKDLPDGCDVCWQYKGNWGVEELRADPKRRRFEGAGRRQVKHRGDTRVAALQA